jgi:hypothetical protein
MIELQDIAAAVVQPLQAGKRALNSAVAGDLDTANREAT